MTPAELAPTATGTELIARCRGVSKRYGTGNAAVVALDAVDLDVRRGEILMIVGPSGSGKTTLISILAGLLDCDSGECRVLDRSIEKMSQNERALFRRTSLGFVFQSFNLLPALTAVENAAVPLVIAGEAWHRALPRARTLIDVVGLSARAHARPAQLSGGEQQRVAIARALVHEPKLILCDEPTSALDHDSGQRMMELMRTVARKPDRAVVMVTHDARVLGAADRVVSMEDGRVVGIDTPKPPGRA